MHRKVRIRSTVLALAVLVFCAALLWQYVFKERYMKLAYPEKYTAYVQQYAAQNDLDPYLVFAVVRTESGFNPRAVSNIGALGLMQLTPDTFAWAQSKTPEEESLSTDRLYDPATNIRYGTVVLSALVREFGREDTALAAYHAGRTKVKSWLADSRYSHDGRSLYHIPFADTRAYVQRVLDTKTVYRQLYGS
ncbi:lytic transglycosylase domain-containing protein [Ethanoligenens harbinense]|uniref:Lytic transglycosylase catalytic n=1 Tax=Ethanoligenens harbinense (strain DSM 18485 / JCM 12961 / CGMCC 1.5033 / YUAN-3) TaxID=663278 RepID=E6U7T9_ETHHY|nr:lytic transglycosylase domain-containing protein [Ethanoligenens harbinense]ADU28212.1 Lytic transglycosylase catalytic [Ethanoligenens harbinense YUAN-3]AVQ97208.1 lytic transglycosylase [Ethanoligenens harbinense YUAN-3]AYF39872.1 lytic transglycosylase [Ethanoligenens harbinense]AYF42704.1 lytic transglycosylase [Ethanoligenens harbinense]QCN93454.1 lytic transglycosylase domain-containing protein [Ethanoligenens harbinense]